MDALLQDLRALLGNDAVTNAPTDRSAYAHDFWPRHLISTRGGLPRPQGPRAVVWPQTREQLAALVRYARQHAVKLVPYGAGSGVTGALWLENDVIAVDLKRMRTLHSVDLERGIAVADAGMLGQHLEDQLAVRGATLGHFPSSIYCSTLGGWIATRSAGQCSGRYGKIEDMVLGLEGVLGTGEPFDCGPGQEHAVDARALMVGSEGLFGFLTKATMRIWPRPTERRFGSLSFATVEEAYTAMRAMFQAGLRPAVTRLYDPFDSYIFKTGKRRKHDATRSPGERRPLREFVLRRLLTQVRVANALNDRFGRALFGRSLLVLMFEGTTTEGLHDAHARAMSIGLEYGGRDEGEAYGERWLQRRHAVSYRLPGTYASGLWVDTFEVASSWARLDALHREVRGALGEAGFVMAHMSHAYPDGCSIYFTFAGGGANDSDALARYTRAWQGALQAAHRAGGTISHHHGVGRAKRAAMRLELRDGVDVIEALARAADPDGILARGPLIPTRDEAFVPTDDTTPRAAVSIDPMSRLVTVTPDATTAVVNRALAAHGLSLRDAPAEGTVGAWLAKGPADTLRADPVDHLVAGWCATLPDGRIARVLPVPRRAAGPDLFTLFATGASRFGALKTITLRVHGRDERGPAWMAPCTPDNVARDGVIDTWLSRVDLSR